MVRRKRLFAYLVCAAVAAAGAALLSGCGGGGDVSLYQPVVSQLTPKSGPIGTIVTATGRNFGPGKTADRSVTFNGVPAAIISWSDTRLVVGVPDGATTGPFRVTTSEGASNGITFTVSGGVVAQRPHIDGVTPDSAEAGEAVTITGTSFGDTRGRGASGVYFNGIEAQEYTSWSDTRIVAEVPLQLPAGDVSVVVATGAGSSNAVLITIVPGPPVILSLDPESGYQATEVTISGRSFGKTQGDGKVRFGDEVAELAEGTEWSDTRLVVLVPPGLEEGSVPVTVTTEIGTSNEVDFLVLVSEIAITIDPNPGTVKQEETLQFEATVEHVPPGSDDTVTWSAHPWGEPSEQPRGKIDADTGLYEAPKLVAAGVTTSKLLPGADKIIATSNLDPAAAGTAIVYFSLLLDEQRDNLDLDLLWTFSLDKTRYDLMWVVDGPQVRLDLVNGAEAAAMDVMTLQEFDELGVDELKAQSFSTDSLMIRPQEVVEGQVIAFKTNEGRYVKAQIDTISVAGAHTGDEEVWIRFFVFEE
jgi:hypothetical protein